ncbi:MAG: sugar phosphate isomerase/epimerase [Caldilineaceae bacterium]|nr:sugar phosphate isomerase/epimerase [Caldilineaceae bacterium]
MRLGVVGMLPADPAEISLPHLTAIRALKLTGVGLSVSASGSPSASAPVWQRVRRLFADEGMDIVQVGIGYRDCLFDPEEATRARLLEDIRRGLGVARQLGGHVALIRTGSLSPNGSYSPHRENHRPGRRALLLESLRWLAEAAESIGQTIAVETHLSTIMNSPEYNRAIIRDVGSPRMRVVMDYVNHFQALYQVYDSRTRLRHIFDCMGPISTHGHCKDISVRDGFVTHMDEEIPGEGELDLGTALRLWHEEHPDGYMMLEHLPNEKYPLAAANVHRILEKERIPVY